MKKFLVFVFCLVAFLAGAAAAEEMAAARYYIPPSQFNTALEVMDLGFANVFGLFSNATGSFEFEDQAKTIADFKFAIDASTLIASNPDNERDLAAMIGIAQYPEISFTAPDGVPFVDGKADIKGTLTLHGISKPFTLEATLNRVGKSPYGGGMWANEGAAVGISLRGAIKRADFGITDDPQAKSRFGDTITLMLEMQAIKQ